MGWDQEQKQTPILIYRYLIHHPRWKENKIAIDNFICPITLQYINKIGVTSDGKIYEKSIIIQWLSKNNTSPLTGLIIEKLVYPCDILQDQLDDFYEKNPIYAKKKYCMSVLHCDNVDEVNDIINDGNFQKLLKFKEFDWKLFQKGHCEKRIGQMNINELKYLIENTLDLECEIVNGWRPIHIVCRHQSLESI